MSKMNGIDRLRNLLADISLGSGDPKLKADAALKLLETLAREGTEARAEKHEVMYIVEQSANGLTLAERRKTGNPFPFRCPEVVYNAIVVALASNDRAMPLDEIVAAVVKSVGDQPPDYQVRVPLRLWLSTNPPLVNRNRARYRPAVPSTFEMEANKLWARLLTK